MDHLICLFLPPPASLLAANGTGKGATGPAIHAPAVWSDLGFQARTPRFSMHSFSI
jgi:hypothetical protein